MGFQKNVELDLAKGYEGSPVYRFYPTTGYMVNSTNGVKIGTFTWKVLNTENQVSQAKGSNTQLAGLVVRNNSNVNPSQGFTTEASLTILDKKACEIANNGEYYVKLVAIVGNTPITQGAYVYISNTTGEVTGNGGGDMANYTKTNYQFISVASELTAGQLVKISNVSNVMGV